MPTKEFERTRDRLRWAKQVHVEHGLIGTDKPSDLQKLMRYYRGNQWVDNDIPGINDDLLRTANKVFPIANRQQASIAARNPRVSYFPRADGQAKQARHIEVLHNYDIVEQNHIFQLNGALRYHQFANYPGVVRHGYTPPEEIEDSKGRLTPFRNDNPNRPWIRAVAPWNVLIDPRAENFTMDGGAQWVAFRSVMLLDHIKRNENMITRDALGDFKGNISAPYLDMKPDRLLASQDPDIEGYVEVWTVYDLEDRTWKQLTLEGVDNWLREPAEWPIEWEWLPYDAFIVNHQLDTPFCLSLMGDLLPYQDELNHVRTMTSWLTRSLRDINIANANAFDPDEATKLTDAAVHEWILSNKNPKGEVERHRTGGLPQELLLYANTIQDDMRESVGISQFGRAVRENVESAEEAANIQQGQDVMEERTEGAFERFVTAVERKYMQGRRSILAQTGAEEVVRVVGETGGQAIETFVTVDRETLAGEYEFEVVAKSTRSMDPAVEAQKAAVDMQVLGPFSFVRSDQLVKNYLEARRLDPARHMEEQSQQAASLGNARQLLGETAGEEGAANGQAAAGGLDGNTLLALSQAAGGNQ